MTTQDERMKILNMIEEGKISAAEGAALLKALSQSTETAERIETSPGKQARRFRLIITDGSGEKKVNVNLPMGLVKVGIKMGARFAPYTEYNNEMKLLEAVKTAVETGQTGKIVELSGENDERIEIFVE